MVVVALATALVAGLVPATVSSAAAVAASAPAPAASIALALEVASDGRGPFTPSAGAGADTGRSNGVVRTHDQITYRATVNAVDGAADDETIRLEAPANTSWGALPRECIAGSSVAGPILTCALGRVETAVRAVSVTLEIDGSARNGQVVAITGSVAAGDTSSADEQVRSPETVVSAAPRFDLVKNGSASLLKAGVAGPDGEPGLTLTYPITVVARPLVPGQGALGSEELAGILRFRDDVSRLEGRDTSRARLYDWGGQPCGLNGPGFFHSLPSGRGGGRRAVADSGVARCRQSAPGQPIDVSIDGTDTRLDSSPDLSSTGGAIEGGAAPYVMSMTITVWLPSPSAGSSALAVNTFSALSATSVSGQENYGATSEPLANNVSSRLVSNFLPGSGYKAYGRVTASGSTVPGSGKSGDPYATPMTLLRSQVNLANSGLGTYQGAIACDVYDPGVQTLAVGPAGRYATTSGQPRARIEYAAVPWTTPTAGRDATCSDSDGPWFSSPDDVPGGVTAVDRVRAVSDVPGSQRLDLFTYLRVDDGASATRVRNFGQLFFGATSDGTWVHDTTSADVAGGPLSDFVVRTTDLARITTKVVDPGSDAASTPDATKTATAGSSLRLALYPTVTSADTAARTTTVTVTDVLPANTSYIAGSASVSPTSIDEVDGPGGPGDRRQRLTWILPHRTVGDLIDPLVFDIAVAVDAPPSALTNTATVASDGDISAERFRTASRAVEVVSSGGLAVSTTAVHPVIEVGDPAEWLLTAVNTDTSALEGLDLIDVLPSDGDTGGSSFAGRVHLASPVVPGAALRERVLYSAAPPSTISLDPAAESNALTAAGASAGSAATTWCELSALGTAGCPRSLAEVTAVRILRGAALPVGGRAEHHLRVDVPRAADGDLLVDRFGLRASNLALPVRSDFATVRVVAGAVGDFVWSDTDGDGVQSRGEPGVGGIAVRLTGTDDIGRPVSRSTTTDATGRYLFAGLRSGSYELTFTRPDGSRWTRTGASGDPALDSDVSLAGATSVQLKREELAGALVGVDTRLDVDAGLVLPEEPVIVLPVIDPPGVLIGTRPDPEGVHPGTTTATTSAAGPDHLAFTGTALLVPGGAALLLLLAGGIAILLSRRRRSDG
ncbi:hypothetical protein GCM10022256_04600 [Frondihabitans peucedani]|uniref:SD-repeat containing protein B domain-containing protein n=1 Tax=Frondihabitans peucedani TaxID=598626 RepID=A0ABP8DXZ0_9MICO